MPRRRSAAPGRPQRRSALATWVPAVAFATAATTAATLYAYHVPHNEEVAAIRKTWAELGNFDKLFIEYSRVNSTAVPYRVFTDVTEDEANRRAAARDGATAVEDAKTALGKDLKKLESISETDLSNFRSNPFRLHPAEPAFEIFSWDRDILNCRLRNRFIPHEYQIALQKSLMRCVETNKVGIFTYRHIRHHTHIL